MYILFHTQGKREKRKIASPFETVGLIIIRVIYMTKPNTHQSNTENVEVTRTVCACPWVNKKVRTAIYISVDNFTSMCQSSQLCQALLLLHFSSILIS